MRRIIRRWGPPVALVSPSLILLAVFVYGLLAVNAHTSATDVHTSAQATGRLPTSFVGLANYAELLGDDVFQHSLYVLLGKYCVGGLMSGSVKG